MSRRRGLLRAIQAAWRTSTSYATGTAGCVCQVPPLSAQRHVALRTTGVGPATNVAAQFRRAFVGSSVAEDEPDGGKNISEDDVSGDDASRPRAGKDMMIVYTCAKCSTRSGKSFSKQAYTKGVVIVTCPGCDSKHLIADNLGWFGEETNVEALLGERVDKAEVGLSEDGTLTLMDTETAGK